MVQIHMLPEVWSDHLAEFHSFADEVAPVKPVTDRTNVLFSKQAEKVRIDLRRALSPIV